MQYGDEHGPLDRKPEGAVLQEIVEDRVDPQPLPDLAEQHRPADPLRRNGERAVGVLVERGDQQHLVGEPGARGDEGSERAGGDQFIGAAEIGDHPLTHRGAFAPVLDDLHVAALAGRLEAEEHGRSQSSTTESKLQPKIKCKNHADVALHFARAARCQQ